MHTTTRPRYHSSLLVILSMCLCYAPALTLAQVADEREQSPLTIEDELRRVVPSQVALSPDGQQVLFVLSELDWEENKRRTHIRSIRLEEPNPSPRAFTGGKEDRAPSFSPDGSFVAFTRSAPLEEDSEKKARQLWAMPADGGEAVRLTDLSEGVKQYRWGKSSNTLFFIADEPTTEQERKDKKKGNDAISVFDGPNGQGRASWSGIWSVDLVLRDPKRLTKKGEAIRVLDFDVSPDETYLAMIYRTENARNGGNLAELALVHAETGERQRLTENEAPESRIRFSPDGDRIAYLAPSATSWELRQNKLFAMDLERRDSALVSAGFAGAIRDFHWSSGDEVFLFATHRTRAGAYSLSVGKGETEPRMLADGVAGNMSWSRDGATVAFSWSTANSPPEVAIASEATGWKPSLLTDLNPQLRDRRLSSMETIRWKSSDGLEVEGLLFRPAGVAPATKTPLILEIHGGPAGVYTNSWRADRHFYGGLGYSVLSPNVRGSTAYGDDLLRGNMNDIGGGDYADLMTGVDALVSQGLADPERMGVRGWSYGGILGGWVVTQTDRFKAASLGAMVSDWRSEYGQGFSHDVRLWYIGGDPWTNPEGYREKSSLTHIKNAVTPTLLLHGEQDTTCTIEQSMNFFNALWEQGTDTRFIRFPREGHGIREPRHLRVRFAEEIQWMEKHVMGREWEDGSFTKKIESTATEEPQ